MMGLGCMLLGSNVAQYRIWDGMRAIDYLQSRGDIRRTRSAARATPAAAR